MRNGPSEATLFDKGGSALAQGIVRSKSRKGIGDTSPDNVLILNGKANVFDASTSDAGKDAGNKCKLKRKQPVSDKQLTGERFRSFIATATDREMKSTFPKSWNIHQQLRNRTRPRRKASDCSLHPDLNNFKAFMLEMGGPAPGPDASVDRKDPQNFTYGPGLIRWSSPKGQARNRTTNIYATWRDERRCLAEWAEVAGIAYKTLQKRHHRGKSDAELFREATVGKYRPTQEELKRSRQPEKLGDGVGLICRPEPPPLPARDDWPAGVDARKFEAGYRRMLVHKKRAGATWRFSKAHFCAFVLLSRVLKAEREVILPKYPDLFHRQRIPEDDLSTLDAEAASDPIVRGWLSDSAILATAWRAYELELEERAARDKYLLSGDEARWVHGQLRILIDLSKTRPCLTPGDVYRLFERRG
jgi:hypothetical protein